MCAERSPSDGRLLNELLVDPRERLDVEFKGWLDLSTEEHKAVLAKAILALANHGGGFLVLGYDDPPTGPVPSADRPPTLDAYGQDLLNGIVRNYAEPAFHCAVHYVPHPVSGLLHPIVGVPGGHRVPVRAKRGGPGNQIVQQHAIYIRRPGPSSEQPLSAREWDELLARCLDARRDELLDRIRDLLTGRPPDAETKPSDRLEPWREESERLWRERINALPVDSPSRCPHGSFQFAYELNNPVRPSLAELKDILLAAPKLTGWSTWWVPTRQEIAPYIRDNAIECWLGGDTSENRTFRDAAHADFWRVSPAGLAFLLRGYQEDGNQAHEQGIEPGSIIDPTLPVWRVGEALLHAAFLGERLEATTINFEAVFTGLRGRRLAQWANPLDGPWVAGSTREDIVTVRTSVAVDAVSPNLVEIVQTLLSPFYECFDFSRLPLEFVQRELAKLRNRQ